MGYTRRHKSRNLLAYFVCGGLGAIFGTTLLLLFGPGILFSKMAPTEDSTQVLSSAIQSETTTAPGVTTSGAGITDINYSVNLVMPALVVVGQSSPHKTTTAGVTMKAGCNGVVIDKQGYVVTRDNAYHMEEKVDVLLYGGDTKAGTILWCDEGLNLAVIKMEGTGFSSATLGDSSLAQLGDEVVAMGFSPGILFSHSISSGILSDLNRTIKIGEDNYEEDLLQTDVVVDDINDGGPLVNGRGEVIGINLRLQNVKTGFGYAIPIDCLRPILAAIKKTGSFTAPVLGIRGIDGGMASYYPYKFNKGIYVYECVKGSPADTAGIKEGDCILAVGGSPVNALLQLRRLLYAKPMNSTILVSVKHKDSDKKEDLKVNLVPFDQGG